jgi:hypothetical protein
MTDRINHDKSWMMGVLEPILLLLLKIGDWSFLGAALTAHREPTRPHVSFGSLADIQMPIRDVRVRTRSGPRDASV